MGFGRDNEKGGEGGQIRLVNQQIRLYFTDIERLHILWGE